VEKLMRIGTVGYRVSRVEVPILQNCRFLPNGGLLPRRSAGKRFTVSIREHGERLAFIPYAAGPSLLSLAEIQELQHYQGAPISLAGHQNALL